MSYKDKREFDTKAAREIYELGQDLLSDDRTWQMKEFIQHGHTSVYEHVVSVAKFSLVYACFLEDRFGIKIDKRSLVRGALLHDYFLYDWHVKGDQGYFHGYTHPYRALKNAKRDFDLNNKEMDIIKKHMFPLTPFPPRFKESMIVCMADKWCALCETFKIDVSSYIVYRLNLRQSLDSGRIVIIEA